MTNNEKRVKIFLLNGPPYSGKDTLADHIINNDGSFIKGMLSSPIKSANKAFFGLSDEEFRLVDSQKHLKDQPHERFLGKSWRQVNIDLAEEYVKKLHGKEAFAKLLIQRIKKDIIMPTNGNLHIVISDCGFNEEVTPLIEEYGADNIYAIKLHRKDHDYSNDSRNYIDAESLGIREFHLKNKNIERYKREGYELVQAIKRGIYPQTTK